MRAWLNTDNITLSVVRCLEEVGHVTSRVEPKAVALADVADQARSYAAASRSENTRRAYRADWEHFAAWCERRNRSSFPLTPSPWPCT